MLERDNQVIGVGGNNRHSKTSWLGMWRSVLLESPVRHFIRAEVLYINLCHMLLIRQNSDAEETELWQSLWLAKKPQCGTLGKHLNLYFLLVMTTWCCFLAILRLFEGLWRREPEWHMALEWTQQLLEDARGFTGEEKCRGQWREAKVNKHGVQRMNRGVSLW